MSVITSKIIEASFDTKEIEGILKQWLYKADTDLGATERVSGASVQMSFSYDISDYSSYPGDGRSPKFNGIKVKAVIR